MVQRLRILYEWNDHLVGCVFLLLHVDLLEVFSQDAVDVEGDDLSHLSLLTLFIEKLLK